MSFPATCWSLFAASVVPVENFYAFEALPNIFGTYRVSKQSKVARKWARNMRFSAPVAPGAKPETPTFLTLL